MRIGDNPNKENVFVTNDYNHQVIIPVHIPNEEGYFKDSLSILKICLDSLIITVHNKTFITIVCNECSIKVMEYINELYEKNKVHEIIFTNAIGKVNAVLKGLAGQNCQLVTISDADVLFLNDWQKATYKIFESFPKAGVVCSTPSSKVLKQSTANIFFDYFFSKKIKMVKVKNPNAMRKFADSLGNPNFYKEIHLQKNLIIENNNCKAVVGAGHFVATYKRIIFKNPVAIYSEFKMGEAMKKYFDAPVLDQGFYRLSTENNYTYHLGNTKEKWMLDTLNDLQINNFKVEATFNFKENKTGGFRLKVSKLFFRFLTFIPIWKLFLQYKGLTKEEAQNY